MSDRIWERTSANPAEEAQRDLDYLVRRVASVAYWTLGRSERSSIEIRAQIELENALRAIGRRPFADLTVGESAAEGEGE